MFAMAVLSLESVKSLKYLFSPSSSLLIVGISVGLCWCFVSRCLTRSISMMMNLNRLCRLNKKSCRRKRNNHNVCDRHPRLLAEVGRLFVLLVSFWIDFIFRQCLDEAKFEFDG